MGLSLLAVFVIWVVVLLSGSSEVGCRDASQTAPASTKPGLTFDELNRSVREVQDHEPLMPSPYLQLPMFQHSRTPLVAKEHFIPLIKDGKDKLPNNIREMLLPVSPPDKTTRHAGGPRGIVIKCKVNKMEVKVPKRLLGDAPSYSQLAFGTCQANNFTKHYLSFVYDASECGSKRMVVNNRVAYSNTLRYAPVVSVGPIRRVIPFTLPITCHFNRFHYSYKIGYKPKFETHRLLKSMKRRHAFTLIPFDAQWRRLNSSDGFAIGQPMYFQANGPSLHKDGRLYVRSCHVTASKSHISEPRFTVIGNFGCMVDSKTSSQSRFISYTRNTVRFSVDAFVFHGVANKHLFMHCEMSLGGVTPTESDKSCFYNHKTKRWEELHGLDSVCACCESTCTSPPTGPGAEASKMVSSGGLALASGDKDASKLMPTLQPEGDKVMTPLLWSVKERGEIISPVWPEGELVTVSPLWSARDRPLTLSSAGLERELGVILSPTEREPASTVSSQQPEGERHRSAEEQAQETTSPLWPEEKQREVMPPLWPEEEEWEPEGVPVAMVTEEPIAGSTEGWREGMTKPRWIFEEIFGLN